MRELRESYKNVFKTPPCNEDALDYLLYVVELEKKYTASQLCLAIERNNKNGVLWMDNETRYLHDTYDGFFLARFIICDDVQFKGLSNNRIHSFVTAHRSRLTHSFHDGGII